MRKSVAIVAGLILLGSTAGSAFANDKPKSKVRTITGCLSKPEGGGDEYLLTGKNGSTWEVHSSNSRVSLAKHVGQTVTATGVVSHQKLHNMKEDAKEAAKDTGVKSDDREHGHLKITSMRRVSGSCRY
jgi:hypothetical protein